MGTKAGRIPPAREARERYASSGLLSVYDAAAVLGESEYTTRRLIASGQLESVRVGRAVKVKSASMRRLLGEV